MISRISGKLVEYKQGSVLIDSGAICYEVLIPRAVMKEIEVDKPESGEIQLVIYHYFQITQSSGIPVLIGFRNEVEKEFFEKFISVSGIGPRAACRALAENFSKIAAAIDSGNEAFLKSLPGIGARKAGEIIAKLKGKVGKYCLIKEVDVKEPETDEGFSDDIKKEAVEVLKQLQYKAFEAQKMVEEAWQRASWVQNSEDLLNEVYRQRKPA